MDKNRDELLNELIKYYDGEPTATDDTGNDTSDRKSTDGDMGNTRIVAQKKPKPEETLGNTVTVEIKRDRNTAAAPKPSAENESTMAIPQKLNSRPNPVPEEVLGNLDIYGKPIANRTAAVPRSSAPPRQQSNISSPPQRRSYTPYIPPVEDNYEPSGKKRSGFWFATKPLWVTVLISMILVGAFKFWITDTGIIGTYKRNFNYNMGLIMNLFGLEWNSSNSLPIVGSAQISSGILAVNDSFTLIPTAYASEDSAQEPQHYRRGDDKIHLPFADAGNSVFAAFSDGVVCAKSNNICFINKKGETEWSYSTPISDPILSVHGKYIALASKNGTQLCLYKKNKLQYSINLPQTARTCTVSEKGDTVLITNKASYKGSVILVNKKGNIAFTWSSGVNYITSAIPLKSRKVAVGLAETDSILNSYVMIFDIKSAEPQCGIGLSDSLVYELGSHGKNILINGDNAMALMTQKGEMKYDKRYNEARLTKSANDSSGNRVLTYTNSNQPIMEVFNSKGDIVNSRTIENTPDFVDVFKTTVLYNNDRDIICGNANDDSKTVYTAPMTIKKLILLNTSSYLVVYDDCIEIIHI